MSTELDGIIVVNISRETATVSKANFGTIMIISEFATSKTSPVFDRYRSYASLTEMSSDGWASSDNPYKIAQKIFSQNPKVPNVLIGRKKPVAEGGGETTTACLNAIQVVYPDWYGLIFDSAVEQDIKDCAAWTETQMKIFGYWSAAAGVIDPSSTTDIAYFLKAAGYDRTFGFYHNNATNGDFVNAASMGEAFPYDPGSQTWAFKTLTGVTAYRLTSSQKNAVLGKNANTYSNIAGISITEQGKMASGEYIDVIRGVDWITSELQTEIYSELVNSRKIPFTDEGVSVITGIVRGVLENAVRKGILASGSIVLTAPLVKDISSTDKGNRTLPDIKFTAILSGAIQKVIISGTVTV